MLLAAGCGGGEPEPRLPSELAAALAARAESVASLLSEGDACGARSEAQELQRETIAAVNDGRVPAALQEETAGSVAELVESIPCPPPPAPVEPAPTARSLAVEARDLAARLRESSG